MSGGVRPVRIGLPTGVTLSYVEQGDRSGVPMLLLHPWVESLGCFDRLRPLLPQSLRVFAIDQRGHGDADQPVASYDLDDFAADVVGFLDAVGLAAAVLVGSSSGGYVAQQVSAASPHRVLGLVLVGSPRSLRGRTSFADEVDGLTDPIDPGWVAESLTWFPRFHDVPDWYLADRIADGARIPARVWRDALTGLTTAQPPTEAGTITAPTLILWGDRDDLLPRGEQERLAAAIPGAQLVVYANTGHLVLWERPVQVAGDLMNFVLSLDQARITR